MALGRLLGRVRLLAMATARGRGATTAAAAQGAMAAAGARGQSVRACAGVRAARSLRAQADVAARSAHACAEARARAARAFLLRVKVETGTAALLARQRLRGASDAVVSTYLRVAYGESAPQTPSPAELLDMFLHLVERARKIEGLIGDLKKLRHLFDESELSVLVGMILGPILLMYRNVMSTAPEASCPFLGLCPIDADQCPVEDVVDALISASATCACVTILTVSGLCICLFEDVANSAVSMVSVVISKEPNNLYNVHSYKYWGLANKKTVTAQPSAAKEMTVVLSTTKTDKQNRPADNSEICCADESYVCFARDDEDM